MFSVEVSYFTKIGNLRVAMTTSQTAITRAEAEELREKLRAMPDLATARISINNAPPPPTVDEAMLAFCRSFAEYPVLVPEPIL